MHKYSTGTDERPMICKKTSVTGKQIYHFFSCFSLFLQEGCAKWPEQVLNTKVLFLVDLHRVSNGARQLLVSLLNPARSSSGCF